VKRYRGSMAAMMGAVAMVALDFSVMHSFDPSGTDSLPHLLFATGVMPVVSLLVLVGLIALPRVVRTGELGPFLIGFEAFGCAAVFAFVTFYSIATRSFMNGAEAIAASCRPFFVSYAGELPEWAGVFLEFGLATVLFSVPQVLVALLGGWLARRIGIRARFELANSGIERVANPQVVPGPAAHLMSERAQYASDVASRAEIGRVP
jgi:hypothetical protein